MIGQGMNGSIRADGSPRYAMACTLAGAFTNLIFDPVLIIGFNMGADHMERVKETIQHFERFAGSAWRSTVVLVSHRASTMNLADVVVKMRTLM